MRQRGRMHRNDANHILKVMIIAVMFVPIMMVLIASINLVWVFVEQLIDAIPL